MNNHDSIPLLFIAQDQTQGLVGLRMLSAIVDVFWIIMSFVTMYRDNLGKRRVIMEYFIFNHKVVMVMLWLLFFTRFLHKLSEITARTGKIW